MREMKQLYKKIKLSCIDVVKTQEQKNVELLNEYNSIIDKRLVEAPDEITYELLDMYRAVLKIPTVKYADKQQQLLDYIFYVKKYLNTHSI